MNEYIIFGILIILLIILTQRYYNNIYLKEEKQFRNELIDIDSYFYSDEYIKSSKKRKIWIHIPYEKNARKWTSFGSRNSYNLNIPYISLCIKSVIDYCGDKYDIIIIDDTTFSDILDTDIDILKLSGALKQKYREMCLLQILHKYGGVIVPPSLYLKKSIKSIDNEKVWYVVEINNDEHVSYLDSCQSTVFSGAPMNDPELKKYIDYYSDEIKKDFGEQGLHFNFNYLRKNNISYLDGKYIGTKDKFNNVIKLEDLMENKLILLDTNNIGLYIPHNSLIKRKKFNWYCYLDFEQLLKCKVFISYYMVLSST